MRAGLAVFAASLAAVSICAVPALAQLQKRVDERGVIHYTNMPPPGRGNADGAVAAARVPTSAIVRSEALPALATRAPAAGATSAMLRGSPSSIDRATADSLGRHLVQRAGLGMASR
jgi:hypothetical protein